MKISYTWDAKDVIDTFGRKINLDEVMEAWIFLGGREFAFRMKDGKLKIVFCEKGCNHEEVVAKVKETMEPYVIGRPTSQTGIFPSVRVVREEYVRIIDIPKTSRCHEVIAKTKSGEEVTLFRGYRNTCIRFYNNLMKEHPVLRNPLTMIFFGCPRSEKRS